MVTPKKLMSDNKNVDLSRVSTCGTTICMFATELPKFGASYDLYEYEVKIMFSIIYMNGIFQYVHFEGIS